MANRATESHCLYATIRVEGSFHTQNSVQLNKCQRGRRIVEVYLALLVLIDERLRQRLHVYFQPDCQRGFRTHARTDATELATLNRVMKFELVGPINFITERVEAEDLLPFLHHPYRVFNNTLIKSLGFLICALRDTAISKIAKHDGKSHRKDQDLY